MSIPPSRHPRCGTTPSVVSTRASLETGRQSPCSVPATPVLITCTTPVSPVLYLQCTSDMPAYRYLIVQFPITSAANFCELEVYIRRKFFYMHMHYRTNSTSELENNILCMCDVCLRSTNFDFLSFSYLSMPY